MALEAVEAGRLRLAMHRIKTIIILGATEIGVLLPATGYGTQQVKDLETTINKVP